MKTTNQNLENKKSLFSWWKSSWKKNEPQMSLVSFVMCVGNKRRNKVCEWGIYCCSDKEPLVNSLLTSYLAASLKPTRVHMVRTQALPWPKVFICC